MHTVQETGSRGDSCELMHSSQGGRGRMAAGPLQHSLRMGACAGRLAPSLVFFLGLFVQFVLQVGHRLHAVHYMQEGHRWSAETRA